MTDQTWWSCFCVCLNLDVVAVLSEIRRTAAPNRRTPSAPRPRRRSSRFNNTPATSCHFMGSLPSRNWCLSHSASTAALGCGTGMTHRPGSIWTGFLMGWRSSACLLASLQNFTEALLAPRRAKTNFSASRLWNAAAALMKTPSLCCSPSHFRPAGEPLSSGCAYVGRRPAHCASRLCFSLTLGSHRLCSVFISLPNISSVSNDQAKHAF